jgi:hypothetical protein
MHVGMWWIPMLVLLVIMLRRRGPGWRWRRSGWDDRPRNTTGTLELDEGVRARLELVEQLESRVTELENRLDFTERLLAQRQE